MKVCLTKRVGSLEGNKTCAKYFNIGQERLHYCVFVQSHSDTEYGILITVLCIYCSCDPTFFVQMLWSAVYCSMVYTGDKKMRAMFKDEHTRNTVILDQSCK